MKCRDRLLEIKADLISHRFEISAHAYRRMSERQISAMDIIGLIRSGLKDFYWNEEHQTWNFIGYGFDQRSFVIACSYNERNTLIVTVFWNEL